MGSGRSAPAVLRHDPPGSLCAGRLVRARFLHQAVALERHAATVDVLLHLQSGDRGHRTPVPGVARPEGVVGHQLSVDEVGRLLATLIVITLGDFRRDVRVVPGIAGASREHRCKCDNDDLTTHARRTGKPNAIGAAAFRYYGPTENPLSTRAVPPPLSRRTLLRASILAAGAGLAVSGRRSALAADVDPILAGRPIARFPEKTDLIVLTTRPPQLETPAAYFDRAITPNDAFFVRYHVFPIPTSIDLDRWRLEIKGEVDRPLA